MKKISDYIKDVEDVFNTVDDMYRYCHKKKLPFSMDNRIFYPRSYCRCGILDNRKCSIKYEDTWYPVIIKNKD